MVNVVEVLQVLTFNVLLVVYLRHQNISDCKQSDFLFLLQTSTFLMTALGPQRRLDVNLSLC